MPGLLDWLRDLFQPSSPSLSLEDRLSALASAWNVSPAVAWRIVNAYALQRQLSLEAAVDVLRGLSYDEAKVEIGRG